MYKRVLLKISGEQLSGKFEIGLDPEVGIYLAEEIKKVVNSGCQVVLVLGGGNMVRGAEVTSKEIKRVTADQMGMLSGLINSIALTDIFETHGLPTRCLSNVFAEQVAESYSYRVAIKHLAKNRVVIVAGGIARPYFTHDTAAVSFGLELGCEIVMKATKVDGVYDRDPTIDQSAQKLSKLTYQDALANQEIKIIDKAALGLAMEQKMPLLFFDSLTGDNIARAVSGEAVGTQIS